jgi:hypothetical protein
LRNLLVEVAPQLLVDGVLEILRLHPRDDLARGERDGGQPLRGDDLGQRGNAGVRILRCGRFRQRRDLGRPARGGGLPRAAHPQEERIGALQQIVAFVFAIRWLRHNGRISIDRIHRINKIKPSIRSAIRAK